MSWAQAEEFDYYFYKTLALNEKTVCIGETGLDYYRLQEPSKNKQIDVFEKHINLALELDKPLMIHCREAHEDVMKILKKFKPSSGDKLRGDIHFFSGTWEEAKKYFDLGFLISFTGVITFARNYDEIVKKSPLDKIMIETDAPYVAPVPYRGKRNEPVYVAEIAKKIAEIKGLDFKEVAEKTAKNALDLFKITL